MPDIDRQPNEVSASWSGVGSLAPSVSILIAARNEESTILNCLQAITQLSFSLDALEVLIGNDGSTDQTASLVAAYIVDKPQCRLIDITETVDGLRGKANVLAQLARRANGDYFFFTDADTTVPSDWVHELLRQLTNPVGIVTGVTLPEGPRFFHKLQTIDWLYNLTVTYLLGAVGIPITAMGNNMVVSRIAYEAVGGYDALPFSVTEDYTLFRAIVQQGYDFRNVLDERVLARTKAVDTLSSFLNQRKRWMRGAVQLPGWIVTALYLQYLALPLFILLFWVAPMAAVGLYVVRLMIQTLAISVGLSRLRQTNLWPYALLFDGYQLLIGPLSVLFYWLPTPINWKERNYK